MPADLVLCRRRSKNSLSFLMLRDLARCSGLEAGRRDTARMEPCLSTPPSGDVSLHVCVVGVRPGHQDEPGARHSTECRGRCSPGRAPGSPQGGGTAAVMRAAGPSLGNRSCRGPAVPASDQLGALSQILTKRVGNVGGLLTY